MAQIAAETLDVPIAQLAVHHGFTIDMPEGWGKALDQLIAAVRTL